MKLKMCLLILTAILALTSAIMPSIQYASVPVVEYTRPALRMYEKTVSCSGTIQLVHMTEVYLDSPILASQVMVSVGDKVIENQPLLYVDTKTTQNVLQNSSSVQVNQNSPDLAALAAAYGISKNQLSQAQIQQFASKQYSANTQTNSYTAYIPDAVYAPMTGIVTEINVKPNVLTTGSKPVITIADPNEYKLIVSVNESKVSQIQEGNTAAITGSGFGDSVYFGTVLKIYPTAHKVSSGTATETVVDVEISIDNPDENLKSGMTAAAEIKVEDAQELLMIPYQCILQDENNQEYVMILSDSRAERRNIITGIEQGFCTQVLGGVQPSDILLNTSARNIKEGEFIRLEGELDW